MKKILSISLMLALLFPTQANAFSPRNEVKSISYTRQEVLQIGSQYIGTRYCKGGTSPSCFDCSGFTQFVYRKAGIDIPRVGGSQLKSMHIISAEEAHPGDLVFFPTRSGYIYHVGIYAGDGMMIHSPKPGQKVKVAPVFKRAIYATIEKPLDNL
jgi:cell wall-associated NlpC family hydrolase